ncbi:hypothetical protein AB0H76_21610 [Nocardia sp. NPDC050712]|uniref:hypothetical protein n=1 Tax=Nocardia sp. NPDC050712 TaxID=3155518 RepID=UPI0033C335A2
MNSMRRFGAGLTGLAVASAVVVLAAPQAHAAVESIAVSGSGHAINTTYTLKATVGGAGFGLLVYWTDNGEDLSGPKVPWPVGESSIDWTPKTKGRHIITCAQGGSTKSLVVDVIDPADPVDPGPGPGTPGTPNTGSAGKILGNVS